MHLSLQGRVALVTGGASGIGRAAALLLARAGAAVMVADLADAPAEEVARLIEAEGGRAAHSHVDVTSAASVTRMVDETMRQLGGLHCAFNNAGVADRSTSLATSSQENWDRVMAVNLEGVWRCMQAQIDCMTRGGGGTIVNNASRSGLAGVPSDGVYGASKHGVIGLTKAAAVEFAASGIRVNAICPGLVDTALTRERFGPRLVDVARSANPLGRMATPEEIAQAALWLLSDASSFVVGVALPVDGGSMAR